MQVTDVDVKAITASIPARVRVQPVVQARLLARGHFLLCESAYRTNGMIERTAATNARMPTRIVST